jgi:hypothetical protein
MDFAAAAQKRRRFRTGVPVSTDRLRHDLDQGRGRDKIPFPDPAAAPLGTDDEAAGMPPTRFRIALARVYEIRDGNGVGPGATDERARALSAESFDFRIGANAWVILGTILCAFLLTLAAAWAIFRLWMMVA